MPSTDLDAGDRALKKRDENKQTNPALVELVGVTIF